jgi:sugar/nucleoside kinase (ribokinase family)
MKPFASIFGQMNVDLIFHGIDALPELGTEVFASNFAMCVGGGPIVIPYHLEKLGVPAKLGTILESDFESHIARELLERINYKNISEFSVSAKNPVVFTSVLTSKEERSFISFNAKVDETTLSARQLLDFYEGSSVTIFPHNLDIAKELHSRGVKLILDSSWTDDISLDNYLEQLPYVKFFTPNSIEARSMCDEPDLLKCLDILEKYLEFPLIKMGFSGVITKIEGKYFHIPPVRTFNSIDTTGAGDNFVAGLMYGMWKEFDLLKTLKCANILGGLSTEVLGCFRCDLTEEMLIGELENHPEVHQVFDQNEFIECTKPY